STGRRAEFGKFAAFADEAVRARIPDPNAASTFEASKLRWEERLQSPHREFMAHIAELLAIRHRELVPHLAGQRGGARHWRDGEALRVEWPLADGAQLHLLAHFGTQTATGLTPLPGRTLYEAGVKPEKDTDTLHFAPGAVRITLQNKKDTQHG
ncbi:MAG: DUF3459 domain-containing protein, partial [Comamonadaceae bacterium]